MKAFRTCTVGIRTYDVVHVPTQYNGLDLETTAGDFGDKRVGDSSNSALIEHGPTNHHRSSSQSGRAAVGLGHKAETTHDKKHQAKTVETIKVKRATANAPGHEAPGEKHAYAVDSVLFRFTSAT